MLLLQKLEVIIQPLVPRVEHENLECESRGGDEEVCYRETACDEGHDCGRLLVLESDDSDDETITCACDICLEVLSLRLKKSARDHFMGGRAGEWRTCGQKRTELRSGVKLGKCSGFPRDLPIQHTRLLL